MRIINKILTVSILSLMAIVPLAGVTTTNTDTIISENRKIFPFPTEVKHCLKNFSKYLDDRYFGKLFISERFSHFYDDNVGGFSPDIFSVPGVNGWRFLGNSHSRVYDQHSIYLPLNNFSLNSLEKKLFELSQFNKNFYVFVGPDKASIYPENMKKEFMYPGRYRYFNQVKNKLTQSGYRVIDPRDELIKEKKQSQLYYKQDTHWNPYGAYIGYKVLMNSSIPQMNSQSFLLKMIVEICVQMDLPAQHGIVTFRQSSKRKVSTWIVGSPENPLLQPPCVLSAYIVLATILTSLLA